MPINQYQEVELFELFLAYWHFYCVCSMYSQFTKKQELIFDIAILILLNTQNDQKDMVVYLE